MRSPVVKAAADSGCELEVQYAVDAPGLPTPARLRHWAQAALEGCGEPLELVIRIVDEAESRMLNRRYRGKDRPTNVLSFPFEAPPGVPLSHLGDVVICAPVVAREAAEQGKTDEAHWAHMLVHGILHLRGYEHEDEPQAGRMEAKERAILAQLGYGDPYG